MLSRSLRCLPKLQQYINGYQSFNKFSSSAVIHSIVRSPLPDIEIRDISVVDFMYEGQEKFANKVAYISGETGETLTYGDVKNKSIKFGSYLTRLGYTKGDVIALSLPNCPIFPVIFEGTLSIGAILTPLNYGFTSYEIIRQLKDSGASLIVCDSNNLDVVREATKAVGKVRHVIVVDAEVDGTISFDKVMKDDGKGMPSSLQINGEDIALLPYSSGTTGLPKGVMLTHRNLVANCMQTFNTKITDFIPATDDFQEKMILALPLYHIYGMAVGILSSIAFGHTIITMKKYESNLFIDLHKQYKVTAEVTAPPLLSFMCASDLMTPDLLSQVKYVLVAAAPVGPALWENFKNKFGDVILSEGYGMTELSPVAHIAYKSNVVVGSCGLPVPNTYTKIIDIKTGEILPLETGKGEVVIKGPQVMKGYWKNAKATKETIDKDGWLHTGDIGKLNKEGHLYIVDRLKELIKVKGFQVPPAELEDLLRQHSSIDDVAVIGIPHKKHGEAPKAFVVPKKGVTLKELDVTEFVEKRAAEYKWLVGGVQFVKGIPKTDSGKILRKDLKAQYA